MNSDYFYVPCDAGGNVNKDYRFYFRLYRKNVDGKPRLVDQGLEDKLDGWKTKFNADIQTENPYPTLD
jgi:hypothetical protein